MHRFAAVSSVAMMGILLLGGPTRAAAEGSIIVSEGVSAPNRYSGALPGFFEALCDSS